MDVTDAAVQNLVTQFSSAFDFYRELVQNSMDAGSNGVEVWLEYLPGDSGGTIAIHVDDFGEGMNEEIIDDQLTRLFSSSKENDLTKIGKFGIGFVSVFALKPKAVLVHTGRGGEYWEVLFHEDRSFNKGRVDTPVEGTQITLFISGDRARYREVVLESRRTLAHWCQHSDVEVTFEDRSSSGGESGPQRINLPFAVAGQCGTEVVAEETKIVMAYDAEPAYGFYNKGLALAVVEGENDLIPPRLSHVAFKIKSRYLEHTLSRETVMRDRNYDKAMSLVINAADGPLFEKLVTRIRTHVEARIAWGLAEIESYLELLGFLAREPFGAVHQKHQVPLLRTVDGRALSMDEVWDSARGDGRIYVSDAATPLTQRLSEQGSPVLLGRGLTADRGQLHKDSVVLLLRQYAEQRLADGLLGFLREKFMPAELRERATNMLVAPEQVLMSVELLEGHETAAFVAAAHDVLERSIVDPGRVSVRPARQGMVEVDRSVEFGYRRLVPCRVTSRVGEPPLFVVGRTVGPMMGLPPPGSLAVDRGARPEAAVNVGHPQFRALFAQWPQRPRLAAYCLAKDLLLAEDRLLRSDQDLIHAALEVPA
jgi:hypothetical protein